MEITPVAPVVVPTYYLFGRGGVADGRAGLHYAAQRAIAELVLSIKLLERALSGPAKASVTAATKGRAAA